MLSGIVAVFYFLLSLFFTLVIFLLWARIFMRYFHISSLHPVSQMVNQLTNPLVAPFQYFFRRNNGLHTYDWPAFIVLIIVELLKYIIFGWIAYHQQLPVGFLILLTVADLLVQPLNFLFYALIVRVIMSWLNPQWQQHPVSYVVNTITAPLISLGHRLVPNISGFDFAPFIMMIIIKVVTIFISASLPF